MVKLRNKKKKGQSTLEYILLATAVVAVLIIFLRPNGGLFSIAFNETIKSQTNGMQAIANRLANSH